MAGASPPEQLQPEKDVARQPITDGNSYGQILKTSSIIGGSKGANYVISMIRTKLIAILLGPDGVGLITLYQAIINLLTTIAGAGIGTSAVREIAAACGTNDATRIAITTTTIRRLCWFTGILGALATVALSYPLSLWSFESPSQTILVAFLGIAVVANIVSQGQVALLQGMRHIRTIALINVLSAIAGTLIALLAYPFFGETAIVPVLIATAFANLVTSWFFARQVATKPVQLGWRDICIESRSLLSLGFAFMWGAVLSSAVALIIRSTIVRSLGLTAAGVYGAAWSLSGMFAGFVLSAMAADFFPRLTAVSKHNQKVNRLVNEQMEIGVLLALPGLSATLAFAPWVMRLFYSEKFITGADLLPWFVFGVMLQVIGWPLGMIQRAKGATFWVYLSQTEAYALLLIFSLTLMYYFEGVIGVAVAMPVVYLIHVTILFFIARHLSGFSFSRPAIRVQVQAVILIIMSAIPYFGMTGIAAMITGAILTALCTLVCIRGIVQRIGKHHRIVAKLFRVPGMKFVCDFNSNP